MLGYGSTSVSGSFTPSMDKDTYHNHMHHVNVILCGNSHWFSPTQVLNIITRLEIGCVETKFLFQFIQGTFNIIFDSGVNMGPQNPIVIAFHNHTRVFAMGLRTRRSSSKSFDLALI